MKLPLITPIPFVIGESTVGAEITTLSRMIASCLPTERVVTSPNVAGAVARQLEVDLPARDGPLELLLEDAPWPS